MMMHFQTTVPQSVRMPEDTPKTARIPPAAVACPDYSNSDLPCAYLGCQTFTQPHPRAWQPQLFGCAAIAELSLRNKLCIASRQREQLARYLSAYRFPTFAFVQCSNSSKGQKLCKVDDSMMVGRHCVQTGFWSAFFLFASAGGDSSMHSPQRTLGATRGHQLL